MYQYLYIDTIFLLFISLISYVSYKQKNFNLLLGLSLLFIIIMLFKICMALWAINHGLSSCQFTDLFLECNK